MKINSRFSFVAIACLIALASCSSNEYAVHQYRRGHHTSGAANVFKKHNHPHWQHFERVSPID